MELIKDILIKFTMLIEPYNDKVINSIQLCDFCFETYAYQCDLLFESHVVVLIVGSPTFRGTFKARSISIGSKIKIGLHE